MGSESGLESVGLSDVENDALMDDSDGPADVLDRELGDGEDFLEQVPLKPRGSTSMAARMAANRESKMRKARAAAEEAKKREAERRAVEQQRRKAVELSEQQQRRAQSAEHRAQEELRRKAVETHERRASNVRKKKRGTPIPGTPARATSTRATPTRKKVAEKVAQEEQEEEEEGEEKEEGERGRDDAEIISDGDIDGVNNDREFTAPEKMQARRQPKAPEKASSVAPIAQSPRRKKLGGIALRKHEEKKKREAERLAVRLRMDMGGNEDEEEKWLGGQPTEADDVAEVNGRVSKEDVVEKKRRGRPRKSFASLDLSDQPKTASDGVEKRGDHHENGVEATEAPRQPNKELVDLTTNVAQKRGRGRPPGSKSKKRRLGLPTEPVAPDDSITNPLSQANHAELGQAGTLVTNVGMERGSESKTGKPVAAPRRPAGSAPKAAVGAAKKGAQPVPKAVQSAEGANGDTGPQVKDTTPSSGQPAMVASGDAQANVANRGSETLNQKLPQERVPERARKKMKVPESRKSLKASPAELKGTAPKEFRNATDQRVSGAMEGITVPALQAQGQKGMNGNTGNGISMEPPVPIAVTSSREEAGLRTAQDPDPAERTLLPDDNLAVQGVMMLEKLQREYVDFVAMQEHTINGYLQLLRKNTKVGVTRSAAELSRFWMTPEERRDLRGQKLCGFVDAARLDLRTAQETALVEFAKQVSKGLHAVHESEVTTLGDILKKEHRISGHPGGSSHGEAPPSHSVHEPSKNASQVTAGGRQVGFVPRGVARSVSRAGGNTHAQVVNGTPGEANVARTVSGVVPVVSSALQEKTKLIKAAKSTFKGGTEPDTMRPPAAQDSEKEVELSSSEGPPKFLTMAELKKYVGSDYASLNLRCVRSAAILKLCVRAGGLRRETLYDSCPTSKKTLDTKIDALKENGLLIETDVEDKTGKSFKVYTTSRLISAER